MIKNIKKLIHWPLVTAFVLVAILVNSVVLLGAFEAHVVNVTAKIERRPGQCAALSLGYWANHEGCGGGAGESVWANEVNALSATYSGVFATTTGAEICEALWMPNCAPGGTAEGRLCRARAHTLADLLNVVSDRLNPAALLAGAVDGDEAFELMDLTASSPVTEALAAIETFIVTPTASRVELMSNLRDAALVAERIYSFYEAENPLAPQCVLSEEQLSLFSLPNDEVVVEPEPEVSISTSAETAVVVSEELTLPTETAVGEAVVPPPAERSGSSGGSETVEAVEAVRKEEVKAEAETETETEEEIEEVEEVVLEDDSVVEEETEVEENSDEESEEEVAAESDEAADLD